MKKFNILFIVLSVFFVCSCNHNAANPEKEKTSEPAAGETLYSLTVNAAANGKITPNKTSEIRAGEEIVLIVEPNEGYKLKTLTVITEEKKDIAVAAVSKGTVYKFTMPIGNVTVNSEFVIKTVTEDLSDPQADGAVLYKIEHWLQDVDDLETYELAVIQTKSGEAGDETTAAAKTYAGFNVVPFNQKTISENGNTVVKIFYNRKTITYTFNPNGGNWDGDTSVKTVSGLYGAVLSLENPKRPGYDITWDKTKPLTFETINLDFTAGWVARNDTKYTVKYYEQNVEGGNNYTLRSSEERTGTTDTTTAISAYRKTGFDLLSINQVNINGDGSSIVNVYYNRIVYTVTFNTNGGSEISSQQVLYDSYVNRPLNPTKEGYIFLGWYTSSNQIFNFYTPIQDSIILYANWINDNIIYRFHETVTKLPIGTDGTAGTSGEYVLFGDFPQSVKIDDVIIDENIVGMMGDFNLYSGSDNNVYVKDNNTYYKVEPIRWRVLTREQNGNTVLLAENILMYTCFNSEDYNNSAIRSYLNNDFLGEAFTTNAIDILQTTTVESDSYVHYSVYNYEPVLTSLTQDKVYILSSEELEDSNLFENPTTRIRTNTEYASAKYFNPYNEDHFWWLRSSRFIDYRVDSGRTLPSEMISYIVGDSGAVFTDDIGGLSYMVLGGVVPAITVYLPE